MPSRGEYGNRMTGASLSFFCIKHKKGAEQRNKTEKTGQNNQKAVAKTGQKV